MVRANSSYQQTQHLVHSGGSINRSGLIFPQNFAKSRTSKQTLDLILTHVFYGIGGVKEDFKEILAICD